MNDFSKRSYKPELLDGENIPFADIKLNMQELNTINSLLGGHAITIAGVKKLLDKNSKNTGICEIGCGGGDNLRAIDHWCKKNGVNATFTGIDLKKECIDYAREANAGLQSNWINSDYRNVSFTEKPDIIFNSLFCHHFTENELIKMFTWMYDNCNIGFFVNDLQRHPLAYHLIKGLTSVFSASYLVKHDAPASVTRGFKKQELAVICKAAGINTFTLSWQWAFRYLLIVKK